MADNGCLDSPRKSTLKIPLLVFFRDARYYDLLSPTLPYITSFSLQGYVWIENFRYSKGGRIVPFLLFLSFFSFQTYP